MAKWGWWLCLLLSPLANAAGIKDFTKGMELRQGYFDFYYQASEDKVFLLVDKIEQPFIFQSSLPRGIGSNDIGLDRGQLGETRLVQFEPFGNKLLLKQLNTYYRADSHNVAERASIDEAFATSVLAGLPVVASESGKWLVDYTAFLLSDIHQIAPRLAAQKQGTYKPDAKRSGVYLKRSKAFPLNTELEALVTYAGSKAGEFVRQVTPEPDAISVHLHHSLIALPEAGYQQRDFHPYSGYWKVEYMDYAAAIDQPMVKRLLPRHRLQKKNPDAAVSEAVAPIVYYLDPGVPEPVRTALYDGAMWWNTAFEQLGYKDAFQVKDLPADADPMDVRYNVIQWVHRATRGWSYGAGVTDPRTGEILKGHVTLGSLRVRQDFLIASGLTGPYSGEQADVEKQKAMALARIRQLSAHEVGHTIGLIHNFAASANGRASVMDYPHPLVELQNNQISLKNAYREGLGEWDHYAIQYGYGDYNNAQLTALVTKAKKDGLEYMADADTRPAGGVSAIGHLWDNGGDPVAELTRLAEVRRFALTNFGLSNIAKGQPLSSLQEALVPIYLLHRYQVEAVSKLLGGAFYEYELKGEYAEPKGIKWVSADKQQQALASLLTTLTPEFLALPDDLLALIPPKAYGDSDGRESFKGRTGLAFDPLSAAEASANHTLSMLLHPLRLNRLAGQGQLETTLDRLLAKAVKNRNYKGTELLLQQRVRHVTFYQLMNSLNSAELSPEARAILYQQMQSLGDWLDKHDKDSSLNLLSQQWEQFEDSGAWSPVFTPLALPPGSPI
ncbi:zinc-dependent metalloprotease [Bowmanella pacifica]|uniref:Periplasmic metalloprotease n=1 Tax=Bowmanella pacifica TaxID=502051 RepID=A0A918DGG6_9ALTE|nr:zinc-dependent metalloprotease [Bowmanella pacifica]GGO65631.1 periplasmic metalloprotease [Bowmanella pacifica]